MNAERLHAIALAVRDELDSTEEVSLIEQLAGTLRNQVNEPAHPDYPQQTAQHRAALNERLASAPSNNFSAAWHETLEELNIAHLLGEPLRQRIEEIFLRNEITTAVAADEVQALAEEVRMLRTNLDQVITGLEAFHVGAEELAPGEFEIGFLIPREAVDNELEAMSRKLIELKKEIIGPLEELVTGTRSDIKVKTISSSDFQFFLETVPDVAVMLSQVIVDLYAAFEKVKRIRKSIADLIGDVRDESLELLREDASESMNLDIDALATKLLDTYSGNIKDDKRRNEMKIAITHSLRKTAKRLEESYTIEIREYQEPPEPEEGEQPVQLDAAAEEARRVIAERQPLMRRLELPGEPILELEEGDDDGNDDDDGGGDEGAGDAEPI